MWDIDPEDRKGSFVRWQSITIGQLTIAINVFLGFAGAALAFGANLLVKESLPFSGWPRWLLLGSMAVLLLSLGLGGWCAVNRLRDFRATTRVARKREAGAPDSEIKPLRDLYLRLGKRSWAIFWWQLDTFFAGVLLMIASVAGQEWSRAGVPPMTL